MKVPVSNDRPVYYVHPHGNDTNDGLAAGPYRAFRTVGRAIEAIGARQGSINVEDGYYNRPIGYPAENILVIK